MQNSQEHEIVLYQIDDTNVCVSVYYNDETFWLTTKAMAELFGVNTQGITKHLGNIYDEGELIKEATCSKMEQVQIEGDRTVRRMVDFYNLDAIIAVGYRVNSKKATRFRQWATRTLKEFITKGFVLNDEMLKNYFINEALASPASARSGSLLTRMARPEYRDRIFVKTGTLVTKGGSSLSGYLQGRDGHWYIFSIIHEDSPVADARIFQDRLCKMMMGNKRVMSKVERVK